jgi:hypothetical protein
VHLKEVSIECEEKLRVKDKVNQIVKIMTRNGVLTENISFKKIPRPEGCKLTLAFVHQLLSSSYPVYFAFMLLLLASILIRISYC